MTKRLTEDQTVEYLRTLTKLYDSTSRMLENANVMRDGTQKMLDEVKARQLDLFSILSDARRSYRNTIFFLVVIIVALILGHWS